MVVGRPFSAAVGSIAVLLLSWTALAQSPSENNDADLPGRGRPIPRDDRTGHLSTFAGATLVVPGGDLGGETALDEAAGVGAGVEAGLGLGLTRYSTLGVVGQFVRLEGTTHCATCRTQMFAVGLGLTYHTSQALGFDPWVRFGAGYRALIVNGPLSSIHLSAPDPGTFHGIDVANFSLGGDYFPTPWLGLGLFFEGNVGIDVAAPSSNATGAVYGLFQAGLRIALEPQRKPVATGVARASTRSAGSPGTPAQTGGSVGIAKVTIAEHSYFHPSLYNSDAR